MTVRVQQPNPREPDLATEPATFDPAKVLEDTLDESRDLLAEGDDAMDEGWQGQSRRRSLHHSSWLDIGSAPPSPRIRPPGRLRLPSSWGDDSRES
jgi:hypothetical protein